MAENSILTLTPFLNLARDLAALLAPIRPQPNFKAALGAHLIDAARQLYAQQALEIRMPAQQLPPDSEFDWRDIISFGRERRWVVGAAAVGSAVSVAGLGLLAYLWRQRSQRAA